VERVGPSLGVTPRLEARPGLRLLSYLAMLATSAVELDAAIDRAVAENPLLERAPWHTCPTCGLATTADRCAACAAAHWHAEPEDTVDWRADLLRDAAVELPAALHPDLELVVGALDDHGLLPAAPDVTPDGLREAVAAIRAAGPPGIAARSPVDCVRVQAAALVADGTAPEVVSVIAEHWLTQVAEERYAEIARGCGVDEASVRAAIDVLRSRTRPYVVLAGGAARGAPTDVVFTQPEPDGPIAAHVASPDLVALALVPDPVAHTLEARAWIAPYREAADRLIAAITARGHMLARVADELAVRQRGFILDGPSSHVPLRRREVAVALDVHPSTVGRAVTDKVARCPDGRIVPLTAFFGATQSTRVRVAAALTANPGATDLEIARMLTAAGTSISRRTITKYRALVANPSSPSR